MYEYYGDKVKDILPALGSHVSRCSESLPSMELLSFARLCAPPPTTTLLWLSSRVVGRRIR